MRRPCVVTVAVGVERIGWALAIGYYVFPADARGGPETGFELLVEFEDGRTETLERSAVRFTDGAEMGRLK